MAVIMNLVTQSEPAGQTTLRTGRAVGHGLSRAVRDRYRCPEEFVEWELSSALSADEGYFQFGPDATCYGRSCSGKRDLESKQPLHDALEDVVGDAILGLPFDPTEIIDNLRLERYAGGAKSNSRRLLKKIYYAVRPFMPRAVRARIQRFRARVEKAAFPKWPVDTTVEDLCERLLLLSMQTQNIEKIPFVWFWPNGANACVSMTHDVETEAGRAFCATLMDLNDSFGIKSSFQVIPETRYEVSAAYLQSMRNRGFEVAVHDLNHDGRLYDDREEFLRRARKINQYAAAWQSKGFRAGALYRNPEWFEALDFSYEMSMPNVAHLDPQSGGCCTVMPYFIGDMLEIPVTMVQDYMLFHLLDQYSIDLWRTQLDVILKKNGLASFIVHPDYIMEARPRGVYTELLGYLRELRQQRNLWVALPGEVDAWWRARSKMSVVTHGGSFRIEGEGAERAVLAFAKNNGGRLVYELDRATAKV